jgi:hypothetical protein
MIPGSDEQRARLTAACTAYAQRGGTLAQLLVRFELELCEKGSGAVFPGRALIPAMRRELGLEPGEEVNR